MALKDHPLPLSFIFPVINNGGSSDIASPEDRRDIGIDAAI
jgi:hypothetical protein